jgi:hypothetical protein
MTRRIVTASGWFIAALLVALGSASWVAGQQGFANGTFVRGSDGTIYAVHGGARVAIAPVPDNGTLEALRLAGNASTVDELNAALSAISAPPSAPANPAETLVGQRVTGCTYQIDFDLAVSRVEWLKTLLGTTAPGNGMWIVAIIDVTNLGNTAASLTTVPVLVRDGRGREYQVRNYPPDPVDFPRAYGVKLTSDRFEPGITEQSVIAFQVPDDVGPLTLVGKRDFC